MSRKLVRLCKIHGASMLRCARHRLNSVGLAFASPRSGIIGRGGGLIMRREIIGRTHQIRTSASLLSVYLASLPLPFFFLYFRFALQKPRELRALQLFGWFISLLFFLFRLSVSLLLASCLRSHADKLNRTRACPCED